MLKILKTWNWVKWEFLFGVPQGMYTNPNLWNLRNFFNFNLVKRTYFVYVPDAYFRCLLYALMSTLKRRLAQAQWQIIKMTEKCGKWDLYGNDKGSEDIWKEAKSINREILSEMVITLFGLDLKEISLEMEGLWSQVLYPLFWVMWLIAHTEQTR